MYKTQPLVVPRDSKKQFILVGQLLPVFMRTLMLTSWRRTVWSDECLPAPLKNTLHLHFRIFTPKNGKKVCFWNVSSYLQDTERKFWPLKFCFFIVQQPPFGQGLFIIEASRSHSDTPHSVGLLWTSDQLVAETIPENTQHSQQTNIHDTGGIRTHNLITRAAPELRLRPRGHRDRQPAVTASNSPKEIVPRINIRLRDDQMCPQ